MSKKASRVLMAVVVLALGVAAWGGGRVLWRTLLALHGRHE